MSLKPDKAKFSNPLIKYSVCFDFDNTITCFDVLDDLIERFSIDKKWMKFEDLWRKGKIGSRECLKKQLASVRITRKELSDYLSSVKVDRNFKKILELLKKKGIRPSILSDNFSFIIKQILRKNHISPIRLWSNKLKFKKNRIFPYFPHVNVSCFRCGHCKKNNLLKHHFGYKMFYIGDGLSDVCPAEYADVVFAKGSLLKHFRKKKKQCIAIKDLGGVYSYLKKIPIE